MGEFDVLLVSNFEEWGIGLIGCLLFEVFICDYIVK